MHGLLDRRQAALQLGIVWFVLQALLIGIVSIEEISFAMQCGALASPALGPVRLELGGLFGILQGGVPFLLGGIGGRAVAVENVVGRLEGNGLGEFVTVP